MFAAGDTDVAQFRRATWKEDKFRPLLNKEEVHWLVGAKLELQIQGPVHASSPVPPRPRRPPPGSPFAEQIATSPLPAPSTPKHVEQVEVQGSELAAAPEPPPEVAPDDVEVAQVASAPSPRTEVVDVSAPLRRTEVVDASALSEGTESPPLSNRTPTVPQRLSFQPPDDGQSVTVDDNDEHRRIREAKDSAVRSANSMFNTRQKSVTYAQVDKRYQAQHNDNFRAPKNALTATETGTKTMIQWFM